jgi:hypothetical protein
MAQEIINIGLQADDGTGDTIRGAGTKINNNFTEVYARPHLTLTHLEFSGNQVKGTQSNADLELSASGTGSVTVPEITIDSTINMTDNDIKVNTSNADLVMSANGTGSVMTDKIDVNSGTIEGTIIGASTASSGAFTTLTVSGSSVLDGVTITDNEVSTNATNANLEFSGNGTGTVSFEGLKFPIADSSDGSVLRTNGSGQLAFFYRDMTFEYAALDDGTATISGASSAVQVIDTFAVATYRSAKYHIQISDATADRYTLIEANVMHDGTNAYISVFGGVDNGTGDGSTVYDSLEFTADVSGGNVRLLGTVNNTNNQVVKFVRRPIKV